MCKNCDKNHSNWYKNHHQYNIDKDIKEIFTGFCKEKNHSVELKYFCKSHNKLCCPECITKIKDEKNGQHRDCDICTIKEIEKSKKIKLNENIKCLEELSINLENSINKLKILFENMNNEKENLKLKIQKIFTKLRSDLNNREDELLLEIDKKNESFISDDIINIHNFIWIWKN